MISEHVTVLWGDYDWPPAAFAVKHQHPVIPPQGVPPNFRLSLESLGDPIDVCQWDSAQGKPHTLNHHSLGSNTKINPW
ncbi:uncharacterized protein METZ01_LOCUS439695 [marine metagenome]|uniref:Uncharacterized protein n=1 Tax=marine metagenome TaxID=408172 RepID=A0A382YUQ4_9ZZZZ